MPIRVTLTFNDATISRLAGIPADAARDITHAVKVDAERAVPVDTGALRSTITDTVVTEGPVTVGTVTAGGVADDGTDVDYALYVEYGTERTPSQPFLRPALYAHHTLGRYA